MNKKIVFTSIFILSILFSINSYSQGYKIKVEIKGAENQQLILGYHKNDNLIPKDTVKTNSKGIATFEGKKPLNGGMYFIFLPSAKYFDFLISDDQVFEIKNDTTDIYSNASYKGSKDNELLSDYHNFLMAQNKKMTELNNQKKKAKTDADKKAIDEKMKKANEEYVAYFNKSVSENEGSFFATFIKATREIEIPKEITDQTERYYYYKNHYFDNLDISDPKLLFTPFYENKIDAYFDKILVQSPDTLIAEADIMLAKTKHNEELYKYMLIHLFNKYATNKYMFAENVHVHLGYIYVEDATWSTDSFKNQLVPKLNRKSNCLIGNKAKNITMQTLPGDSLGIDMLRIFLDDMKEKGLELENDETQTFEERLPELSNLIHDFLGNMNGYIELDDIEAKYTILWFFEPDCSHCKKQTPLLYKAWNEDLKDNDVAVMCIYLERNTDEWAKFCNHFGKWFDFVQKNKMYGDKWYNVANAFENHRNKYDISSTPVLYLLDENKKIIAKRIAVDQAVEIIKSMEK